MMDIHEQRMCEIQGEFFELSIDRLNCSSSLFISRFMNSDIAKELDKIDDPYNFLSPNNLITIMENKYPSLQEEHGKKLPKKVIKWIGYIYRAYCVINKTESSMIYKCLKTDDMVSLYDSFHTFSVESCVERLLEIVNQNNPLPLSDYEVLKRIYESN